MTEPGISRRHFFEPSRLPRGSIENSILHGGNSGRYAGLRDFSRTRRCGYACRAGAPTPAARQGGTIYPGLAGGTGEVIPLPAKWPENVEFH